MDKNIQIPGQYIIRFQTAPVVPAPFSHFYTLQLGIASANQLNVDFSIVYTDREEMDEDDLLDEGFSTDDDYKWKGALPANWINEFEEIFSSSKTIRKREESEFEDFIELELEENGKMVTIYPVDKERWSYFLQEFMQAIFEASGREKPFELTFLEIDADKKQTQVDLIASFARKTFTLSKGKNPARQLEWAQLQRMMDTVYKAEFVAENASESRPSQKGLYITAGDGLWYQLGVAVLETTAKSKDLPKIEALFKTLAK
ncbi:hypothetical protein [Dyadobacter sediminis]|uniref:Uncharacterized protein n=1 Tax=Dyadobacter sediminis TaxID=1493691 RepID=A0A5R9KKQ4_9BACT|nr:hypothetical protein [Dyadobacter sediminis]TLU96774.1 hypothetical protein FEM55_06525 [Dyadobacter sediminis]GGB85049.1 hypothetical protein GCM10011325_10800 [Dyadobacter sediminis]